MMKCVFALVLLHLCYCVALNSDLIREMIQNVDKIHKLVKTNQVTFNTTNLSIPGSYMNEYPGCCLGVFKRNLTDVLDNVESGTHSDGALLVSKLRDYLDALGHHAENDTKCIMKAWNSKKIFGKYADFLRKLFRSDLKWLTKSDIEAKTDTK